MLDERVDADAQDTVAPPAQLGRSWRGEAVYWALSVAALVGITTWLYGPHVFDSHWILNQPDFDWAQEVWFLAWPAYAVVHGHNPFFSAWVNYPRGLNLMENTSMPLLGIVFAPVTWALGPIVTYSVVLRVGMVASAASAQWVGRRLGLSRVASFLAGLLYAFSTVELLEGNGHAFLTFVPIPPVVCYLVYRLATGRGRPLRAGLGVGVLLGLQALISLEIALMTVLACVLGLAVAALCYPRAVTRGRAQHVAASAGLALVGLGVVLAVPMVTYFGPGHFWGPAHADLSLYRAHLVALAVPGSYTWLGPHLPLSHAYERENGAYLGVATLAALVVVAVRGWRVPLVRVASVTLGALLVLSLGSRLDLGSGSTSVPLPWAVLARLPFLDSLLPVRLFILIGLAAGLLLGWGLDRGWAWARRRGGVARGALVVACAAVVLVSLAPARPYPASPTHVPAWLASSEARALVPAGSVALFYPYPSLAGNQPMLYQAADAFRYRIIGGQGIVTTKHANRHAIGPLPPFDLPTVFLRASTGELTTPRSATLFALPALPPLDRATIEQFHAFVTDNGVTAIVVTNARSSGARLAERYLRRAFGLPVVAPGGGVEVWPSPLLVSRVRTSG